MVVGTFKRHGTLQGADDGQLHEWIFCSTACLTMPESGNEHEDCFAIVSSFTSKTILFDCSLSPSKKE